MTTANGSRLEVAKFERGLPEALIASLGDLGKQSSQNWWKDVLANKDLHIAIRGGYLNVYAKGQSVFKVGDGSSSGLGKDGKPHIELHYKYLLKPKLPSSKDYVRFDGHSFFMDGQPLLPASIVQTSFVPSETVKQLVASAETYSGEEKRGVHEIAKRNSSVIDLEIAFTKTGEDGKRSSPRIDLGALQVVGEGDACLTFYEAKLASDVRLRDGSKGIEVVRQMKSYDEFVETNEKDICRAYFNVCRTFKELKEAGSPVQITQVIDDVAMSRKRLVVDPKVKLLIFGYDSDHTHRESSFNKRVRLLENEGLSGRVFTNGSAKFDLGKLAKQA
jgi:hypothetical protein